ncbi:MAG: phosphoenolpyruvate--protein phosphotransferase [Chloroflexi bacterium]|nr:phosphoenolpyruvate--protein phosphotransferase [Chloroflexota bacterium]
MELRGVGAAPGVAIGPVWRLDSGAASEPLPDIRAAADRAAADLTALAVRVRAAGRPDDAAIFEAQALMALDPMLLETAEAKVAAAAAASVGGRARARHSADLLAAAVESSAREAADVLATLPDELLAARAADVRDVGGRIARVIAGRSIALPDRPSIALAEDLPPSVTAEIPEGLLLGIALERGSAVSHAAILARGLGIPAVVAVPELLAAAATAPDGLEVGLDGAAGRVLLAPTAIQHAELEAAAAELARAHEAAAALRNAPGQTADGHLVPLLANIGRPDDAERALAAGAEGVGLFRTEFLFVGRSDAPSEDEQAEAYAEVLRAFGSRPVVIRLLDIGGDKPVPYLHLEREDNPFLGVRGLRLGYRDRDLLVTQLRAIARSGAMAAATPWVMAPMVATVEDVELVHALAAQAVEDLDAHGVARAASLKIGIMVEVPSAALMAPELGRRVAFFSVGSNDLTQYVLAMDRTHPALATVADALHPAVLRAIRLTVDGARQAGIEVAVCGELGGDPLGAQVLVGLGVAELSMDAARIGAVRLALRARTLAELQELAARALACGTASEVRAVLEGG